MTAPPVVPPDDIARLREAGIGFVVQNREEGERTGL